MRSTVRRAWNHLRLLTQFPIKVIEHFKFCASQHPKNHGIKFPNMEVLFQFFFYQYWRRKTLVWNVRFYETEIACCDGATVTPAYAEIVHNQLNRRDSCLKWSKIDIGLAEWPNKLPQSWGVVALAAPSLHELMCWAPPSYPLSSQPWGFFWRSYLTLETGVLMLLFLTYI